MFSRTSLRDVPAIVIDCGTCHSRVGFSSGNYCHPKVLEPTVISRMKHPMTSGTEDRPRPTSFVGKEAMVHREGFSRKYPVEWGCITDFEVMEHVWRHLVIGQLGANPEEHPVVYVEGPVQPRCNREKIAQVFFETFNVPGLFLQTSSEACLYSAGHRRTGMVVEAGGGNFVPAPVVDGYVLRRKVPKTVSCGRDLTFHLLKLLHKNRLLELNQSEVANQIKEQLCYVAPDFGQEQATFSCQQEREFLMPNGTSTITVGIERFLCPEAIFQPLLQDLEMPGLHEIVFRAIMSCDEDLHQELLANVVLCGGSSLFPGMATRLEAELQALAGPKRQVQVVPCVEKHAAFKGAVMLAQQEDFYERYLTKEYYDEYGPDGIVRHCI